MGKYIGQKASALTYCLFDFRKRMQIYTRR